MRPILCAMLLSIAASAFAINFGDPAPALKTSQWVAGQPVDPTKSSDTILLLFFFDPKDPSSNGIVLQLGTILDRFKGKKVVAVAIAVSDGDAVKKLVGERTPEFAIAVDDNRASVNAYAGEGATALPQAAVVKDAKVLWIGYPSGALVSALDQIIKGTYDIAAAKNVAYWRGMLEKAIAQQDLAGIVAVLDELIKLEPENYQNVSTKVEVLRYKGDKAGVIKARRDAAAALAGSADGLNHLAWDLVTEQDLSLRDPELALKCAQDAVSLSKRKDAASLDTLARAWYDLCLIDKAIEVQKEAKSASVDEEEREQVTGTLTYYETVRKAREAQRPAQ